MINIERTIMKRILLALAAVALFATTTFAAGSAWESKGYKEGYVDGSLTPIFYYQSEATTDSSTAAVPVITEDNEPDMAGMGGLFCGYVLVFGTLNADGSIDATAKPTSVAIAIKDAYGNVLNPDSDDTVETATVRYDFDKPVLLAGGLFPAVTAVGNSKKFTVVAIMAR